MTEPLSVKLARHAMGVVSVVGGAVSAGRARRGEVSQRRDAPGPAGAARLPQIRADERLRAMLERLFDGNYDHRRRLLAVDDEAPLEDGIDADPGSAVDPIGLVRAGNQED